MVQSRNFYFLFKILIPLTGRNFAHIGESAIFINNLRFDNTKDLLRINIATLRTSALSFISRVDHVVKVNDRLDRVSIVDLKTTNIHDDERIKHLKDV